MNPAITVRVAQPGDADRVTALLTESYPTLMAEAYDGDVLSVALPQMTRANPELLSSGSYYVAEHSQGLIVGCGGWTMSMPGTREYTPGIAHIRHFATHPRFARRGVGRLIYERCAAEARSAGAQRMRAFSSLNAVPFYESVGLARKGLVEITLGPGVTIPSVLMEGSLA